MDAIVRPDQALAVHAPLPEGVLPEAGRARTRPRERTGARARARASALATLFALATALAACTAERRPLLTPGGPTAATPDGTPTAATAGVTASATASVAPTPGETLRQPATLDRQLADTDGTAAERRAFVEEFVVPVVDDARVLDAMRAVPRHAFVPTAHVGQAYEDHPLPIGFGQTISQPSLVAMMTELLELESGERVLEIGTGSGYQAAILRELTDEVYTVEIIPELAGTARAVLDPLGYDDVALDRRDGYFGWPEHGPFDAIIVTAAPDHLPQPLVNQLADGGRMVIPIGPVGDVQTLWLVRRVDGEVEMEKVLDVLFVPFTRESEVTE